MIRIKICTPPPPLSITCHVRVQKQGYPSETELPDFQAVVFQPVEELLQCIFTGIDPQTAAEQLKRPKEKETLQG